MECQRFHEPCSSLHQGKEQSNTDLFLQIVSFLYITFLYYIFWSGEEKEENCGWGMGGGVREIGQSSLTGRIVFHILFKL